MCLNKISNLPLMLYITPDRNVVVSLTFVQNQFIIDLIKMSKVQIAYSLFPSHVHLEDLWILMNINKIARSFQRRYLAFASNTSNEQYTEGTAIANYGACVKCASIRGGFSSDLVPSVLQGRDTLGRRWGVIWFAWDGCWNRR